MLEPHEAPLGLYVVFVTLFVEEHVQPDDLIDGGDPQPFKLQDYVEVWYRDQGGPSEEGESPEELDP